MPDLLLKLAGFFSRNRDHLKMYSLISTVLIVATMLAWGTWWVIIPGVLIGGWIRILHTEYVGWEKFYGHLYTNRRKQQGK